MDSRLLKSVLGETGTPASNASFTDSPFTTYASQKFAVQFCSCTYAKPASCRMCPARRKVMDANKVLVYAHTEHGMCGLLNLPGYGSRMLNDCETQGATNTYR